MITNLGNKNNSPKKKKKKKTTHGYIFITSLSFGVLAGWTVTATKDVGPLPLGSSLARMGKVAKTNSWLWEITPPSEKSLGAAEDFVISKTASLGFSFSFLVAPICSAPFGGLLGGGRSLVRTSLIELVPLGAALSYEAEELGARIARG